MAIAKGKINASRVQAGDRILVKVTGDRVELSRTKTGEGVQVARVAGKEMERAYGTYRGSYALETTAGTITGLAPIQTMWLAPEDPAGVKRAHAEALLEEARRNVEAHYRARSTEGLEKDLARAEEDGAWDVVALIQGILADREAAGWMTDQAQVDALLDEVVGPEMVQEVEERLDLPQEDVDRALELAEKAAPELASRVASGSVEAVLDQGPVTELKVPTPRGQEVLDQVAAYAQVGAGIYVAPMGTPAPGPEDLADLALALAEEDLEHLEPGEVRTPKPRGLRCQAGDVVTIHRGDRLYEVLRVEEDSSRDAVTGEVTDHTLARVAPCDPEDHRNPQWVHVDLLHVRTPVARVQTMEITERVRQAREVFTLKCQDRDRLVAVRTIQTDSQRVPTAVLVDVWRPGLEVPVATLRVGEAIVVDGRALRVVDLEGTGELSLEPARWRDRLPVS